MIEDLKIQNLRAKADQGITKNISGVSTAQGIGLVKNAEATDIHLRIVDVIPSIMKINALNVLPMGKFYITPLSFVDLQRVATLHLNQINRQFHLKEMEM